MAVLLWEDGAEEVRNIVYSSEPVLLPFVALMEVEYKLLQHQPEVTEELLATLDAWPVQLMESFYRWRREAARIKAQGRISLADAWVASLALINDAELVHKDPEFDAVVGLKSMRLPYKQRGAP